LNGAVSKKSGKRDSGQERLARLDLVPTLSHRYWFSTFTSARAQLAEWKGLWPPPPDCNRRYRIVSEFILREHVASPTKTVATATLPGVACPKGGGGRPANSAAASSVSANRPLRIAIETYKTRSDHISRNGLWPRLEFAKHWVEID
jgi:hypothetical protein